MVFDPGAFTGFFESLSVTWEGGRVQGKQSEGGRTRGCERQRRRGSTCEREIIRDRPRHRERGSDRQRSTGRPLSLEASSLFMAAT